MLRFLMSISDAHAGALTKPARRHLGLMARLVIIFLVLAVETLPLSYLVQGTPSDSLSGAPQTLREIQHWLFRFLIAYAVSCGILLYLRGQEMLALLAATGAGAVVRVRWLIVHLVLLAPLAVLSAALYGSLLALPFGVLALAWHACALAAAATLCIGMAPAAVWLGAVRRASPLPLMAVLPAAAALGAIKFSQELWAPAANVTFHLVGMMLRPVCHSLRTDPATLTLITEHFSVTVSEVCSGLEGIGLMLAFCAGWLWYFRRDYRFPRALVILPVAVTLVFILNAVRIAALVLIGDAGFPRIASVGFHSQAGWIAFNLAAFAVAIGARRSPWLHRRVPQPVTGTQPAKPHPVGRQPGNPAGPYLFPLLSILAAGIVAHALSAGFDSLYPLRLVAGVTVLWICRQSIGALDWRASWRGPLVGGIVFLFWWACARKLLPPASMPEALAAMQPGIRFAWIACRAAAAMVTVPIAEELAYRGFLMRRLVRPDFEAVPWRQVGWPALTGSAVAFGLVHGSLWLPGILTGLAYGILMRRTGKIGECVLAHATTNALLAGCVLVGEQWQLW